MTRKNEIGKNIIIETKKNVELKVRKRRSRWKDKILERKRVTRRATGGKKVSFRVTVIVTKQINLKKKKKRVIKRPKPLIPVKPRRIPRRKRKRRRRVEKIGLATSKGKNVRTARKKAVKKARKKSFKIRRTPFVSILYSVLTKYKAAKILLKPAFSGYGVIAGTVTKTILEQSGFENVVGKCLGSSNKLNNAKATFAALKLLNL